MTPGGHALGKQIRREDRQPAPGGPDTCGMNVEQDAGGKPLIREQAHQAASGAARTPDDGPCHGIDAAQVVSLDARKGFPAVAGVDARETPRVVAPAMQHAWDLGQRMARGQQSVEQIEVLGPGSVLVRPQGQHGFAPEHPGRMWHRALHERVACDLVGSEQSVRPGRIDAVAGAEPPLAKGLDLAADEGCGVSIQKLRLHCQSLRVHLVVGVHARNPSVPRARQSCVQRTHEPVRWRVQYAHARISLRPMLQHARRCIRGAVIHAHQLELDVAARQHGAERGLQRGSSIAYGQDDTDGS